MAKYNTRFNPTGWSHYPDLETAQEAAKAIGCDPQLVRKTAFEWFVYDDERYFDDMEDTDNE